VGAEREESGRSTVREEAALPFRSEPPPDPETTPNPMRLARRGLLAKHFLTAGFRDVRTEAAPVATVYSDLEEVARIQMGSSLAELCESLGPADLERLRAPTRKRLRPVPVGSGRAGPRARLGGVGEEMSPGPAGSSSRQAKS
jgi:hypothetical protein